MNESYFKLQYNFRNFIVFCPLSCYVTYVDTVQSFEDQKEEKKKIILPQIKTKFGLNFEFIDYTLIL